MEFHPFLARRQRKAVERAREISPTVATTIMDHLSENGDVELRIPVGQAPRKVDPDFYLRLIAAHAATVLYGHESTIGYSKRLIYDDVASRRASMHIVKSQATVGGIHVNDLKPELNETGLTMVFVPTAQQAEPRQA